MCAEYSYWFGMDLRPLVAALARARAVLEIWADFCAEAVPNPLLMDLGRTICPNFERPGQAGHADAMCCPCTVTETVQVQASAAMWCQPDGNLCARWVRHRTARSRACKRAAFMC